MGLVGHVTMTLSGRSGSRARRSDDVAHTVGQNCDPTKGWGVATEFGNEPQRRPDDRSDSTTTLGSGKRRTVGTQRAEVTCFGDVGLEGRCSARRILALLDRRKDGPAPEEEEEVTFLRTVSGRAPTHGFRFHDSRPR